MIPPRFQPARLSQLDPDVFAPVLEYAAELRERLERGRGLVLSGPQGCGKTWALAALTHRYLKRSNRPTYLFSSAYELAERYAPIVGEKLDPGRGQSWTATYDTVEWLVLNDLGKDYRGGKLQEQITYKVGRLIRTRVERELVTHITTNMPLLDGDVSFRGTYGESIWSLVQEACDLYEVDGPDLRTNSR